MSEIIKVGAIFDGYATRKDKTLKLTFTLQEISSETASELLSLHQQFGWLLFAPEGVEKIQIPSEPPKEFKETKSPSQRLRSVLFVYFQQLGAEGDFEVFYREKMEMMVNWVKDKLDE